MLDLYSFLSGKELLQPFFLIILNRMIFVVFCVFFVPLVISYYFSLTSGYIITACLCISLQVNSVLFYKTVSRRSYLFLFISCVPCCFQFILGVLHMNDLTSIKDVVVSGVYEAILLISILLNIVFRLKPHGYYLDII
jgi:hypothetical protein